MPRKFAFDLPHLKLSSSKNDTKSSKEVPVTRPTTPPPKSVRPPLSPRTTAELRAACTYIVHTYKPSHQYFGPPKQDHRLFAYGKLDSSALLAKAEPTSFSIEHADPIQQEPNHDRKYAYRPNVAAEDLFKTPVELKEQSRKNLSEQQHTEASALSSHQTIVNERLNLQPNNGVGPESLRTSGSTPRTEGTDDPWSERISTTMTSAAITPARTSKRASGQALTAAAELPNMPKLDAMDADWMKTELDRRLKNVEDRAVSGHGRSISRSSAIATAARVGNVQGPMVHQRNNHSITRKPVQPPPLSSQPYTGIMRTDSAQDADFNQPYYGQHDRSRPRERSVVTRAARSVSRGVQEYIRPGSSRRQSIDMRRPSIDVRRPSIDFGAETSRPASRARSRARSITQHVQEYIRPGSTAGSRRQSMDFSQSQFSRPASRARSRARSVTQQIQEYIRPGSTSTSRRPSVDLSSGRERQGSFDSRFGHSINDNRPPTASSNYRKMWNPLQRVRHERQESQASVDGSVDAQGRQVNLNRELPPLPGLDSWKDEGSSGDICISWNNTAAAKPPVQRSFLVPDSSPQESPAKKAASHRTIPSEDLTPYVPDRVNEMNRQRAIARMKATGLQYGLDGSGSNVSLANPSPTDSAQSIPSPRLPHAAHTEEQSKRRWWRSQPAR